MRPTALVWLRQDLRLEDQPALVYAAQEYAIVPVFVWAPEEERPWEPGAASRWWLHHSLRALDGELQRRGLRLILRRGPTLTALRALLTETQAKAVFWNRRYEPAVIERDKRIKSELRSWGVTAESFGGSLLFEPAHVTTQQGKPFQVFTPFYKACLSRPAPARPAPIPKQLIPPASWPDSLPLDDLQLLPRIDWAGGLRANWQPGTAGARQRLERFLAGGVSAYLDERDRPDHEGTSRLSPYLHFGEISPRQIWWEVVDRIDQEKSREKRRQAEGYLRQLIWREFAHHLLFHFPHTAEQPLRSEFAHFPWRTDVADLKAWQRGRTGFPLVDAGMRELWTTGWMHNRVRMNVASFLVKHLRLSWLEGAKWFWDTLVDADLANNTLGWQWTAGCGADAAPYFRIFNPMLQSAKFDPAGNYVASWVPELARLPIPYRRAPWTAPQAVLAEAGLRLGEHYPSPRVDHAAARAAALAALRTITGRS
jgi:deoxyribodipyrimidine photo-lyase